MPSGHTTDIHLKFKNLRIAIIHDILYEFGGSERVVLEILQLLPSADFYTLYFNSHNSQIKHFFSGYKPQTSLLQFIPFLYSLGKFFSLTKLYASFYFFFLNLKKYDLIISSSHSFNSKIVRKAKKALHICYLYTPPHYLFDETNELYFLKQFPWSYIFLPLMYALRTLDYIGTRKPDLLITSSKNVYQKIIKYYQREAMILPPPAAIYRTNILTMSKKSYYVFHSRLTHQKGIKLVIETCKKYNLPLKVIGEGYLKNKLLPMAGSNIEFLGWVTDKRLAEVYKYAKALLFAARDEDFGLVPIEAMSFGVPVIAHRSGALPEIVIEGKTGVFFDDYSTEAMHNAIMQLDRTQIVPETCIKHASLYNPRIFRQKLLRLVQQNLKKYI